MLGILVVQDLALGLMLAVLPALDRPPAEIGIAVLQAAVKIGLFALGATIIGIWVVPRFLRLLASTESRELFLLGIVAMCLGIALVTAYLGLSIEMGAFVAGLMISEVEYADQTLAYVEPLRDIFAALCFCGDRDADRSGLLMGQSGSDSRLSLNRLYWQVCDYYAASQAVWLSAANGADCWFGTGTNRGIFLRPRERRAQSGASIAASIFIALGNDGADSSSHPIYPQIDSQPV